MCTVLLPPGVNPMKLTNTEWSKSPCALDDYSTIIRCTETFWSPCIYRYQKVSAS